MLPLLPLLAAGAIGSSTFSFHLMMVKEVYPGSDAAPNAQYVVIQMYSPGQNLVTGTQIRVFDANGAPAGTFTFTANMSVALDQSTILIATPEAQAFFGVVPNLLMMPALSPLGGKVCFHDPQFIGDIDCVSWGGYAGNPAGVGNAFNLPVGLQRGVAARRRLDVCGSPTILDSCDDTGDSANDFRPVTPLPVNNAGVPGTIPPAVCGNSAVQSLEQCDDGNLVAGDGCSATCTREATAFLAQALVVDPTGNEVLETGETAVVRPSWRNVATAALPMTGALSIFFGPAATYTIPDRTANYGTVAAGATAGCASTGDCYSVSVSAATRPAVHWDPVLAEVMSSYSSKGWFLHVGESFTDVPRSNPFYRFIEILLHRGITGGCSADAYCPGNSTTRESMAVFVLVAKEGAGFNPPACGAPMFADVPASSAFCRWIEELARRQVVTGCGGGNYCPSAAVTREQMAVFVLRTLDPTLDPPACPTPSMFPDVPASSAFCKWIEELARRQVVTGCGGGNYCPTAPVSREQMGVFLGVTFGLTLYGV
jgi:cysteine-rich repeat protein